MQVKELMSSHLITVDREETVAAAARLLSRHNVGSLPVTSFGGKLVGMITDRDVLLTNVTCWAKMLRSGFLQENRLSFEEVRFGNDVLFGVKVAVHASVILVVQKPIYDVTYREGSLTTIKNKESLRCRYESQKKADAYAAKRGFKWGELPCAIDFLKAWRGVGLSDYLLFVWREREEIKRAGKIRRDDLPFNYRHPYLYVILILFRFL